MTDQELEPWPEKVYLLHPSIKTFGAMVSNPERREYVRADRIEELEKRCSVYARSDRFLVEEIKELEAKRAKAVEALRCLEIAATGAGVPHPQERKLLHEQIALTRAALAELEGK